jgi:hypothetical protein
MVIAVILVASGCAGPTSSAIPAAPSESTRHRAALASVVVANETNLPLTIAFRTATPPLQEVVIGRVSASARARMAPIPAGEPIILVARREDGAEFHKQVQSFSLDVEFVWDIPKDATFQTPPPRRK